MDAALKFEYDKVGDILYISKCPPYAEQESEALEDDVVVRLNPKKWRMWRCSSFPPAFEKERS